MYYKWKESYNTFGLDGIKSNSVRAGSDIRKLKAENERLKKLLAEKDLENAMLSETLKKRWEVMEIAFEYINKGLRISKVARTMLREIRVKTIDELKERIDKYFEEINKSSVIFR